MSFADEILGRRLRHRGCETLFHSLRAGDDGSAFPAQGDWRLVIVASPWYWE
jgi:hypothetical protein